MESSWNCHSFAVGHHMIWFSIKIWDHGSLFGELSCVCIVSLCELHHLLPWTALTLFSQISEHVALVTPPRSGVIKQKNDGVHNHSMDWWFIVSPAEPSSFCTASGFLNYHKKPTASHLLICLLSIWSIPSPSNKSIMILSRCGQWDDAWHYKSESDALQFCANLPLGHIVSVNISYI